MFLNGVVPVSAISNQSNLKASQKTSEVDKKDESIKNKKIHRMI